MATITTFTPRTRTLLRPPRRNPPSSLSSFRARFQDGKAEDIVTIELAGKTTIADQMVIAERPLDPPGAGIG